MATISTTQTVPVNCNDNYQRTDVASTGFFITSIVLRGEQISYPDQVISASLGGVAINLLVDPPFPCDTITWEYNVEQTDNAVTIYENCDSGIAMLSFHFRGKTLKIIEHELTEPMPNAAISALFGLDLTDFTFEYKSSIFASYTTLTSSQFINTIATAVPSSFIRISYNGAYDIDEALVIRYSYYVAQINPNLTYTTIPIDNDSVVAFNSVVQLSNVTAPNSTSILATLRTQDPSSTDWTNFGTNNILTGGGLTALNAQLSGGTPPYAIHFSNIYSGTNTSGALNAKADVSTAGRLRKVKSLGSSSLPNYRSMNNVLRTDAVNDYVNIPRIASGNDLYDSVWFDQSFSLSCWVKPISFTSGFGQANFVFYFVNYNRTFPSPTQVGDCSAIWNYAASSMGFQFTYLNGLPSTFLRQSRYDDITINLNTWHYFVTTYDATNQTTTGSVIKNYVNGRLLNSMSFELYNATGIYPKHNIFSRITNSQYYIYDNTETFGYSDHQLADFRIINRVLTAEEIRLLYNRGTNIASNYASYYPSAITNDTILNYSFDTPNYVNNTPVGLVTVNDISPVGRNGIIYGQGSTPTTASFY